MSKHDDIPPDLLRVLRDQSIIVPRDQGLWELIASWANAPSNTASAEPVVSPRLTFDGGTDEAAQATG